MHDSEKQLFLVIVLMCVFVGTSPTPTSTHRRNESHKISAEIFLAAFQQKIQKILSGNWKILTMTEPTKQMSSELKDVIFQRLIEEYPCNELKDCLIDAHHSKKDKTFLGWFVGTSIVNAAQRSLHLILT